MNGYRLRLALFLGLIVGPAGVLTFLSLRAVLDEQRSALADLRGRVPALQAALRGHLETSVARLAGEPRGEGGRPDRLGAAGLSPGVGEVAGVSFTFALQSSGQFARPRVLRPALLERAPGFARAMALGEGLELGHRLPARAVEAYGRALAAATTAAEEAEALNALGRAALAAGDAGLAQDTHRRLAAYAGSLDPDGAHPYTLSTLRLVRAAAADTSASPPPSALPSSPSTAAPPTPRTSPRAPAWAWPWSLPWSGPTAARSRPGPGRVAAPSSACPFP